MTHHALVSTLRSSCTTLLATALVALVGCGEPEPAASSIYVGELAAATPTSIALLADDSEVAFYLCDGVSTSAWFFGTRVGDSISAQAGDGSTVQATLAGDQVTGQVTRSGRAALPFTASLATGVAGLFLVEQSATAADGFSAAGGEIHAEISGAVLTGTVSSASGDAIALAGAVSSFGEPSGIATWIVQPDGRVSGKITNTAGGGNCSIWSKIKQLAFGVDCTFF